MADEHTTRRLSDATVARLPQYLRVLADLAERGVTTVSSERLAEGAGVNSANVRKDLSYLGSYGTRGVGYPVEDLIEHVSRLLGLTRSWRVAIVGVGNLGRALASYGGFGERGFDVGALLDADPAMVGRTVAGVRVEPVDATDAVIRRERISIAIIATPAPAAQEVADRLVDAGVTSVLNFAPAHLRIPAHVSLRQVDLSTELQILSYHETRQAVDHLERAEPSEPGGATNAT